MEVFKTFNPEYSAYQLKLRYENRDVRDCSLVNLSIDSFNLPNVVKGRPVTEDRIVVKAGEFWMDLVGNGNNVIGNYKVSSSGIPAYYEQKQDAYFRVNCINSIKQSFLFRINGTCFDLRYALMRSSAPTKYTYSDAHYRIELKKPKLPYPCVLDNIIVHEGFSINFEWFLNEAVEWKWRCLKPEQKQSKKKRLSKTQKVSGKRLKERRQHKIQARRKVGRPSCKTEGAASSTKLVVKKATVVTHTAPTTKPPVKKATEVKHTAPIKKQKVRLMSETNF